MSKSLKFSIWFTKRETIFFILFILLSATLFALIGVKGILLHSNPADAIDSTNYMKNALKLKEDYGLWGSIKSFFDGTLSISEQQPLFLYLLFPFAIRSIYFYPVAKLITLFTGFLGVLILPFVFRNLFGFGVAFLSTIFLISNQTFASYSSIVACEPLFTLFFVLAWFFAVKGFENCRYWAFSGIFSALAFLTKANGFFFVFIFFVFCLIVFKKEALKEKYFWLFFVIFIAISLPLLVRNIIAYGTPLYLEQSRWLLVEYPEYRYMVGFKSLNLGFLDFIRNRSLGELVDIYSQGMKLNVQMFLESFNILRFPLNNILNFVFASLSIFGIFAFKERKVAYFSFSIFALFFVFFGWFMRIGPNPRFYLPLIPIFYFFLSSFLVVRMRRFNIMQRLKPYFYVSIMVIIIAAIISLSILGGFNNPLNSVSFSDGYWDLFNWLNTNVTENMTYALGPSHDYDFFWHAKLPGKHIFSPFADEIDEFVNLLKQENVSYFVMDEDLLLRREWVFSGYFQYDDSLGLAQIKEINNLELVFVDEMKPVSFMIFEVE